MNLIINVKPFSFELIRPLKTSKRILTKKNGWLIHIQNPFGEEGWGEISPLNSDELKECKNILRIIGPKPRRDFIEKEIKNWPGSVGFGIGSALAEMDGLIGTNSKVKWLTAPASSFLLPTDSTIIKTIDSLVENHHKSINPITFKVKVANQSTDEDKSMINLIRDHLPSNSRLRIDANGGWNRKQANHWASHLANENRLEWIEQPLAPHDIDGLIKLSKQIPVAIDESLLLNKSLRKEWRSWQIRRPALEGDPRILLKEFEQKNNFKVITTCFETGIGKRWIEHLAALQQNNEIKTAPGLAPGWCPTGPLFSNNPSIVWSAA